MSAKRPKVVQAAGGVVWREAAGPGADGTVEVLLVHRPGYGDWSLPKGKLDQGETHEDAALREVEEETGLRCRLGPELASTSYRDPEGRPKVVRYWAMSVSGGSFAPNREVDEVRWLALRDAEERLTHPRDAEVLGSFGELFTQRSPEEKG